MPDWLCHLFGCVCGQNPDHTWMPGGVALPICQRCTGLYFGAVVAGCMHWRFRPAPTSRWLWLNGGFLLSMVPFGFHWLPQGPVLRAITGVLFGFGLVAFLTPTLRNRRAASALADRGQGDRQVECPVRQPLFWLSLGAAVCLVPWWGAYGNRLAGDTLTLLAGGGALLLVALLLANVVFALRWLIQRFSCRVARVAA